MKRIAMAVAIGVGALAAVFAIGVMVLTFGVMVMTWVRFLMEYLRLDAGLAFLITGGLMFVACMSGCAYVSLGERD